MIGAQQSRLHDRPQQQNRNSFDRKEENPTLRECWPRAMRSCSAKASGYWTHDFTVCKCLQMWDICVYVQYSKHCNVDSLRMNCTSAHVYHRETEWKIESEKGGLLKFHKLERTRRFTNHKACCLDEDQQRSA